jgi:hypothetical protein
MLVKLTPGASSSGWNQTLDLGIATITAFGFIAKLNFHSVWNFYPKMRGEGKSTYLVPATRKLVVTRYQLSYIRGKETKLGEGET